jgi:hypothetical protein
MSERYPDDAALLALESDAATGVEYIPTGRSPYYLEFRKLVQRLLLAAERANDLRVYQDGDLSIGVRPGRCLIQNAAVTFAGTSSLIVENNTTTWVWLGDAGAVQTSTAALPTDRTTFVPLASVTSEAGQIMEVVDLRGETFLAVPDTALIGLTATAAEINQALAGINPTVDAAALNVLTGGAGSAADNEHHHETLDTDEDDETEFRLINRSSGNDANIALKFDLAGKLAWVTALLPDPSTGWLMQRYAGQAYTLVGALSVQHKHGGALNSSQSGQLLGVVPIDGVVSDVVLSVGANIESDNSADGVAAVVSVNGVGLTTTSPQITDAAGSGFRSTAQGDGAAAVVKTDGTEQVSKGDVLTVDLTRTAAGTVSSEATDVVVLVVVRGSKPE